ncbi:MAG TPA: DUF881 domain-containing protein [Actinomycetota bacterium]|nr:DUF881 domain-containing protein [Actinomycetota bacterium]
MIERNSPAARAIAPAIVVGLLAFLLTVDLRTQDTASKINTSRRSELAAIVAERQKSTAALESRLSSLRAQLATIAASTGSATLQKLQAAMANIQAVSGSTPLSGPGLAVRLSDASSTGQSTNRSDSRIQDVDIQEVVNAMWNAGAEAISINGQRLVATSAIRNAGNAVLVNFSVLTSPYEVDAIGDATSMQSSFLASDIARHFKTWEQVYGLGFSVEHPSTIQVPAFTGSVRFRYAQVQQAQ